jgi:hypothetical protein
MSWPRICDFAANTYIVGMNKLPSPEQTARLERQRLAVEEGTKALQEVAERAIAIRENMVRLRALRLAKEAGAKQSNAQPTEPRRKRGRG